MQTLAVDAWVGLFSSRERLEQYLDETYDADDSMPLSEFAADMDEFFYDQDFFESSFQEVATEDLKTLLSEHSLTDAGIQAVSSTFEQAPTSSNAILLMWNEDDYFQIKAPTSVQKEGVQLRYLGRFDGTMRK